MLKEISQQSAEKKRKKMSTDENEFNQLSNWFSDEKNLSDFLDVSKDENFNLQIILYKKNSTRSLSEERDSNESNLSDSSRSLLSEFNAVPMIISDFLIVDDVIFSDLNEFSSLVKLLTPSTVVFSAATTFAILRQKNRSAHVFIESTNRKRIKSNWQLRLKSQQKTDQQKKKENKTKR